MNKSKRKGWIFFHSKPYYALKKTIIIWFIRKYKSNCSIREAGMRFVTSGRFLLSFSEYHLKSQNYKQCSIFEIKRHFFSPVFEHKTVNNSFSGLNSGISGMDRNVPKWPAADQLRIMRHKVPLFQLWFRTKNTNNSFSGLSSGIPRMDRNLPKWQLSTN